MYANQTKIQMETHIRGLWCKICIMFVWIKQIIQWFHWGTLFDQKNVYTSCYKYWHKFKVQTFIQVKAINCFDIWLNTRVLKE